MNCMSPDAMQPIGSKQALMSIYSRALEDFRKLITRIPDEQFAPPIQDETRTPRFRSIRDIVDHVVAAAYEYMFLVRDIAGIPLRPIPVPPCLENKAQYADAIGAIAENTASLLAHVKDVDDYARTFVTASWGTPYNLEQVLEHAIVHVLRHQRQLERAVSHPDSRALTNK